MAIYIPHSCHIPPLEHVWYLMAHAASEAYNLLYKQSATWLFPLSTSNNLVFSSTVDVSTGSS